MRVVTLNNQEIEWKPKGSNKIVSQLQLHASDVILNLLPGTLLLYEVSIPIQIRKKLWIDIYIVRHNIMVEIQGRQHTHRVKHFQTAKQFAEQQERDEQKRMWCELNNIPLIHLNYNEDTITWTEKIKQVLFRKSEDLKI
jgi:hypothetical protein